MIAAGIIAMLAQSPQAFATSLPGALTIIQTALTPPSVASGDMMIYRIDISKTGGSIGSRTVMRDPLPDGVLYVGPITVTSIAGTVQTTSTGFISNTVVWQGALDPNAHVRVSFQVRVNPCIGPDRSVSNTANARDDDGNIVSDGAVVSVNCIREPNVDVRKDVFVHDGGAPSPGPDKHVTPGDDVVFRFTLRNNDSIPATIYLRDEAPEGIEFGSDLDPAYFQHEFVVPAGLSRTVDLPARVLARCDRGRVITNVAEYKAVPGIHRSGPIAVGLPTHWPLRHTNEAQLNFHCDDLGDAPDSTNHFGAAMTAYPGVQANYPTVFDPATGADQGPKHRVPFPLHLGRRVSAERDADLLPDQDGLRNILPTANDPNRDDFDDGVQPGKLVFSDCATTTIPVQIAVGPNLGVFLTQYGVTTTAYLNAWVDANRDADWADVRVCGAQQAFEHFIIDQPINLAALGAGLHVVNVPTGLVPWPASAADKPAWLRFTLSERPSNKTLVAGGVPYGDGRGYNLAFATGETEDYLWHAPNDPANGPDVAIRKRGSMRTDSGGPITSTATADDIVVWQIDYANRGNTGATNVVITDDLTQSGSGAGMNVTTVPTVPYSISGSTLTLNIGSLAAGASGRVIIERARTLAGHIYTNTATITATGDVDASNNSATATVKHAFLQAPIILNPVDGTTCDGAFSGTRTILGITTEFATVDLYIDGVLVNTQQAGGAGYFRYDTVLADGPHTIHAVAHLNGHDAVGADRAVTVNSALTWDPLSLRFVSEAGGHYRPTDGSGRTDETGWSLHLIANENYTVSVRVCCDAPNATVTLDVSGTLVALTDPDGDGVYQGPYAAPATNTSSLTYALSVDCGAGASTSSGVVLIDPDGTVRDAATGALLSGAAVVCMQQDAASASYTPWPASDFGQNNPFMTQSDGYFAFFTPAGTYRLDVSKTGYQPYRSPDLHVVDVPVRHDVALMPEIATPAIVTIVVDENGFEPALVNIAPGAVVEIVNGDTSDPSISGDKSGGIDGLLAAAGADVTGSFKTGALGTGQRFKVKLDGSGGYALRDSNNPNALGAITVGGTARYKMLLPLIRR